jgi:serine O-acetyltransferase
MPFKLFRDIVRDTRAIAESFGRDPVGGREIVAALSQDGLHVLLLSRLREASKRAHLPLVAGFLRRAQAIFFGVEIASGVKLGQGVRFLHTFGVVIGGDSTIGDRVVFLGSNTVGTVGNRGYPRIGNDVVVGAGARILGPISIGDGAAIGANAVVLIDVPPGATALGVPAVLHSSASSR